jgi:phosphate butyryltransferase
MAIATLHEIVVLAKAHGPKRVALVGAGEVAALETAARAQREGLAEFVLIGDAPAIEALRAGGDLDLGNAEIVHEPSPRQCPYRAVELVLAGTVDLVMNGAVPPGFLVRAVLDPASGMRTGRVFSDVAVFEIPGIDRLIFISDVLVLPAPTLNEKMGIVQNAVDVARALGVELPKVAILSATEMVNPKIQVSLDAANLAKMAQRNQIRHALVDGPLALDNAISPESARIKGIQSEVAGYADILIAPDAEAGNLLAKAITYFAGGKMASIIVGGGCPIVLPSRSDSVEAKLASLALGIYLCPAGGKAAGAD